MVTKEAETVQDAEDVLDADVLEVPSAEAITAFEKAAIDVQIATAHQYPRVVKRCIDELVTLCTIDQETAESMTYALKRKDEGGQIKFITGPSVRFAEMVVHSFGNCRAGGRVVAIDDTMITGQGVCLDLEKNVAVSIEARRRITNKRGKRYSEDMITTTGNAAVAIGFRNAVFKVFPFALVKRAHDAARAMAAGKGVPIEQRRKRAVDWFGAYGKKPGDVFRILGVGRIEDITEEHLEILNGLRVSVQDGTQTIPSIFEDDEGETRTPATEALNNALVNAVSSGKAIDAETAGKRKSAKHGLYMKAINNALDDLDYEPSDREEFRHNWQQEHIGKRSTAQWTEEDYSKAIEMIQAGIGL